MGVGPVARLAVVALALAPAAAWYVAPTTPLAGVVVAAVAIAAALHGLGRLVGGLAGDHEAPPALAVAWGLAAYLGLGGTLAAVGLFDGRAQRVVLVVGTAAGAAWLGQRATAALRPAALAALRRWRPALGDLVPAFALAVVMLHLLGAAGASGGRFFDGEVFHLGPLARLRATGELGDAFGMPRTSGLGGNLLLTSLGAAFDNWRNVHALDDGLAFGLALALAFAYVRRGAMRVVVAFTLVALASATPVYPIDLAPRWTIVALVFAVHQTLTRGAERGGPRWPAVLLAGALGGMWHGGLGAALVLAVHVVRTAAPGTDRRTAWVGVGAALVFMLGGLIVAAALALGREPAAAALLATFGRGIGPRVLAWAAIAITTVALARAASRPFHTPPLATTIAAIGAATATAGLLAPTFTTPWLLVQPLGIALLLALIPPALALVAPRGLHPVTATAVALIVLTLATLRFPVGQPRASWEDRLVDLVDGARTLIAPPRDRDTAAAAAISRALARLPAGARIGLWVERPDLVDYRRHLVDLRAGATVACVDGVPSLARRWRRTSKPCLRFDALLPRLALDYLVVSRAALPRPDAWWTHPTCFVYAPHECIDPITRFVGRTRMLAPGELLIIDLRAPAAPRPLP